MDTLPDILRPILTAPTPAALVALQGALLMAGRGGDAAESLAIAGEFHAYLSELQSKLTAKEYNELASRLDIGAVGVVALENLIQTDREQFWERLLLGAMSEILMVAASRQYIRAWDSETGLVHRRAAWYLAEALWRTSAEMQPDLAPSRRWEAIQQLLAPAYSAGVPAPEKAVLLGRVFQILLLTYLARLLPVPE
jgi:hypothetical protein